VGRELLSSEISDLFETTYFLKGNSRFVLVDYTISADRSASPAPLAPGKHQDTRNLKRRFEGVISIDSNEHKLVGMGNGPISSLANALSSIGIDLDVADYKEHSISGGADAKAAGGGKNVKAVSYIECTSAGSTQKVWGVGIHEDVVQSSLVALLSAASNVSVIAP
jgi:2-isopropylmalate synthase